MSWLYLLIAGIFEVGWPLGIKLASILPNKILWAIIAFVAMVLSGLFLFLAQKEIPMGTAYAIWTSIGVIGAFTIGVIFFNDGFSLIKMLGIILILSGVIILKLAH